MIGSFALRSPNRLNLVGAVVLPVEGIKDGVVFVKGLDCMNGSHLLDIKLVILCK
jgi:tRNA (Thr-GGU) A37 N-methylase